MRLALKTISYGITHFIVAFSVAYTFTGDIAIALGIGLIEPAIQTIIFAFHDYAWEGKRSEKGTAVELKL